MLTFIVSTRFMSSGLLVGMLINCKAVSSAFNVQYLILNVTILVGSVMVFLFGQMLKF
jgi:hypothetical protein